jgi:hypothetical protein
MVGGLGEGGLYVAGNQLTLPLLRLPLRLPLLRLLLRLLLLLLLLVMLLLHRQACFGPVSASNSCCGCSGLSTQGCSCWRVYKRQAPPRRWAAQAAAWPAHLVMLPIMEVCVCQPFLQLLVCLVSLLPVLQYSDGTNIVPVC